VRLPLPNATFGDASRAHSTSSVEEPGMVYEIAGWVGAAMVLSAYALVTRAGTSVFYHVLNITGAAGLLVNALHHDALPSSAVNLVWIGIAVWGIVVSARQRRVTPGSARDR
jgi:hypothetical protein